MSNQNNILARISSIPYDYVSRFNNTTIEKIIDKKNTLISIIETNKEKLAEVLFNYIPQLDTDYRRRMLKVKRLLHNKLSSIDDYHLKLIKIIVKESEYIYFTEDNLYRRELENIKLLYDDAFDYEMKLLEEHTLEIVGDKWVYDCLHLSSNDLITYMTKKGMTYQASKSVYKYILRGATNTTPLTTWSGITEGVWGNVSEVKVDYRKPVFFLEINRLIIRELNKNINLSIKNELKNLYINPSAAITDETVQFWKLDTNGKIQCLKLKLDKKIISILLTMYDESINYEVLIKKVVLCGVSYDVSKSYIDNLIEIGLLVSSMNPSFASINPIEEFLDILEGSEGIKTLIIKEKLEKFLKHYNRKNGTISNLKECLILSGNELTQLVDKVDEISLRINYHSNAHNLVLPEKLKSDAEYAFGGYTIVKEVLEGSKDELKSFKELFIEEIGYDKAVNIINVDLSISKKIFRKSSNQKQIGRHWNYKNSTYGVVATKKIMNEISKNTSTEEVVLQDDFFDEYIADSYNSFNIESVFQYCDFENRSLIIPEMISTQTGRLAGRYLKWLEDENTIEIENEIINKLYKPYDADVVQINHSSYGNKDDVTFSLNNTVTRQIDLYTKASSGNKKTNNLSIGEIKIMIDSQDDLVKLVDKNNKYILPYISSTLSPGEDSLVSLINKIGRQNIQNLNGHGCTRIDLDLKYTPRIIFRNLVLNRKCWRIEKKDFVGLKFSKGSLKMDYLILRELIIENKMDPELYMYSDIREKPYYIDIRSILCLEILKKIVIESLDYVYFEEVLPSPEKSCVKYKNKNYGTEFWSIFNIRR